MAALLARNVATHQPTSTQSGTSISEGGALTAGPKAAHASGKASKRRQMARETDTAA
eukprot:CAMPEP_0113833086 /NCGR_PEP_ID=MMETSP0328-20130328/7720_1 /TAXON_ID=39455 /ORGANISM="Alexandrium minutum" /LENGTH=56 /DNA_ID=CAMNT_0000801333 /DNA_START=33 /DNA_END=200 /DNA_ORIENTATION=+ /assembly_acc=CAM_ASM_000350